MSALADEAAGGLVGERLGGISTISLNRLSYKKHLGSLTEVQRKAFDGTSAVG